MKSIYWVLDRLPAFALVGLVGMGVLFYIIVFENPLSKWVMRRI